MTTWSGPVWQGDRSVSHRQSRRMSRQFSEVGVGMPPQRIREIAMGRPATEDDLAAVRGVGPVRASRWGDALLAIVAGTPDR